VKLNPQRLLFMEANLKQNAVLYSMFQSNDLMFSYVAQIVIRLQIESVVFAGNTLIGVRAS
jgi:hypothetical protein